MCDIFKGPPKDKSADIARDEENARQARITSGRQSIDQTFGKFDDTYYKGVGDAYSGYYAPQLEDQYTAARRKLTLNLARGGNLNSSAGARTIGDLTKVYENNRALIGDRSLSAVERARADVATNKGELYSQLSASADPTAAATTANARAAALLTPQDYSPLGELFASFANTGANAINAERAGYPGFKTGLFAPKNSTRIIN